MNSGRTAQQRARILSWIARGFVACIIIGGFISLTAAAQGRRPSGATKSTAAQGVDVASLLREAAGLMQAGKLDEAEPLLRRAITLAPSNADAHNLLGVILDQRGQNAAAEREYTEALRLNPRALSARANLGVLLARTGRADEAIKSFEAVLREAPDHPQASLNLGLLYVARGDYGRAAPLLEHVNTQRPNTFVVLYNLGVALYELKRLDEAASALEAAASIAPDKSVSSLANKAATRRPKSYCAAPSRSATNISTPIMISVACW